MESHFGFYQNQTLKWDGLTGFGARATLHQLQLFKHISQSLCLDTRKQKDVLVVGSHKEFNSGHLLPVVQLFHSSGAALVIKGDDPSHHFIVTVLDSRKLDGRVLRHLASDKEVVYNTDGIPSAMILAPWTISRRNFTADIFYEQNLWYFVRHFDQMNLKKPDVTNRRIVPRIRTPNF